MPNSRSIKGHWINGDGVYAALIVLWIIAVWIVALCLTADSAADAGGNSFLLACALATAGVVTGFSVKLFLDAYDRWRRNRL